MLQARIHTITYITVAITAIVMSVFTACTDHVALGDNLDAPRDSLPVMVTDQMTTLISDSGVTKFRVTAPRWDIYDLKQPPYWLFPEGLHFDKFAEDLTVYAEVDADSAIYFNEEEKWILVGNVHVMNVNGETFDSQMIIVEQKADRVYTDQFITIKQKSRIINGIGFESNTALTRYTILKPQGMFPIEEASDSTQTAEEERP